MNDHEPLIGPLYDGLSEAEPWSTFLDRACERFEALACSILFQSGRSPVPVASFRAGGTSSYRARYWNTLYLVDPFVGLPPDLPVTFADFSARHGGGARSASFLAEIASPHILGIDVALADGASVRFRLTRSNRKAEFSAAELAACAALVPHMKRAFGLFLRLARAERERDAFGAMPDLLGYGAVMVDCDAGVLATSAAAAAVLAGADGLSVAAGRIVAGTAAGNAALHEAIRHAAARSEARTIRIERPGGGLPLAVVVLPGSSAHAALKPDALLLLLDPDRAPAADRGELAMLLGLTPAEARLAMLLGQGLSLSETAAALGVRMATVRAQLRAIFAKTGVTRQSELVRVVLNYSAAAAPAEGIGRSSTMSRP